jgi:hypothetical protein
VTLSLGRKEVLAMKAQLWLVRLGLLAALVLAAGAGYKWGYTR